MEFANMCMDIPPYTYSWSAINTLSISDGPFKEVKELLLHSKVLGPDKVHHTPVLQEVVL